MSGESNGHVSITKRAADDIRKLLDAWYVVNNGLLLDRRRRRTHGIIADRNRMAATLADHMRTLGVRRKAPSL